MKTHRINEVPGNGIVTAGTVWKTVKRELYEISFVRDGRSTHKKLQKGYSLSRGDSIIWAGIEFKLDRLEDTYMSWKPA